MLDVDSVDQLTTHVGQHIGTSVWLTIDQAMIDAFAAVTGDRQWIHVDPDRARRELPGGTTIAHGYLTLSLLPRLSAETWSVRMRSRAINYGINRLRFLAAVPAGSRVRLRSVLRSVDPAPGGMRVGMDQTVDIEGADRPALVAETITLILQ